ncbi:bifunctional hydroxymethylpyrimidine kinase/phosphomethylpyrimidine kinase [Roseovarius indicus]|uniref:hydroxymethylpyrimidine kinase n=1 Tax=Roseovarius indicus TaxID=540747 RepID=A0A0T5P779_9RHOB|nr:hydroxymethylpyrimidine/phosphomethylpyrimidine kinase [Roseovarius indicus]KRS16934.1 hypothetical protein XM52_15265 [Roseovarius indicus]QEW29588.1 Hydroxymethylpyrimidine/phosphomethylpyrimidine kinase [Roseovarius indicus]SFE47051.1 hydroxymethylpyrimidine/phosphomethylpyrimidine kinase [Roseovarius indicus]
MKRLLIIAGTDSSGGAGLTRDASVAADLGVQVLPVVTAVTAQTDDAVVAIHAVPANVISAQIAAAFAGPPPDVVKIGMLATEETAAAVAEALAQCAVPIVLDPVLASSSGGALSPERSIARVLTLATLLTPNFGEAAALSGLPAGPVPAQAARLQDRGAKAVLIKGGHGRGATCTDHLFSGASHRAFSAERLNMRRRGTGCTLATAIGCHLAKGATLPDACAAARDFLQTWLKRGPAEPSHAERVASCSRCM